MLRATNDRKLWRDIIDHALKIHCTLQKMVKYRLYNNLFEWMRFPQLPRSLNCAPAFFFLQLYQHKRPLLKSLFRQYRRNFCKDNNVYDHSIIYFSYYCLVLLEKSSHWLIFYSNEYLYNCCDHYIYVDRIKLYLEEKARKIQAICKYRHFLSECVL